MRPETSVSCASQANWASLTKLESAFRVRIMLSTIETLSLRTTASEREAARSLEVKGCRTESGAALSGATPPCSRREK